MKTIGRICAAVGLIIACLVAGLGGGALTRNFHTNAGEIQYADFIVVMLTSVAVLMTLLAIFFAVLGVIGWNAISTGVRERTEGFLKEGFQPGKALHTMVKKQVTDAMYAGVNAIDTDPKNAERKDGD